MIEKIDPKDFGSYEEYRAHEEELSHVREFLASKEEEIDRILGDKNASDEEIKRRMEELGFISFEPPVCDSVWCQQRKQCLDMPLGMLQQAYNEYFFEGLLPQSDMLVEGEMMFRQFEQGEYCTPKDWHEEKHKKHLALRFLLAADDALSDSLQELREKDFKEFLERDEVRKFFRSVYLMVYRVLNEREQDQEMQRYVEDFLQRDDVFDAKKRGELRKALVAFV